jgi:purine-binding chemotaxis protein CheW
MADDSSGHLEGLESGAEGADEGGLQHSAEMVLKQRALSLARETVSEEANDLVGILLFRLGEEWYSVKVEDVREIYQEYVLTPVPCTPDFIEGVVNIRGEIISVTDVARLMRLGTVSTEGAENPPAIVIQNDGCATAMVVDEIGDITDIPTDGIEPPLSLMDKSQAEFVAGSVYVNERLIGLISVDRILEPIGASD